jgi:hypothetical protein
MLMNMNKIVIAGLILLTACLTFIIWSQREESLLLNYKIEEKRAELLERQFRLDHAERLIEEMVKKNK